MDYNMYNNGYGTDGEDNIAEIEENNEVKGEEVHKSLDYTENESTQSTQPFDLSSIIILLFLIFFVSRRF